MPAPRRTRRCPRCYGSGEIAVVPEPDSHFAGQAYEIVACPRCGGSGRVYAAPVRNRPRSRPEHQAARGGEESALWSE